MKHECKKKINELQGNYNNRSRNTTFSFRCFKVIIYNDLSRKELGNIVSGHECDQIINTPIVRLERRIAFEDIFI